MINIGGMNVGNGIQTVDVGVNVGASVAVGVKVGFTVGVCVGVDVFVGNSVTLIVIGRSGPNIEPSFDWIRQIAEKVPAVAGAFMSTTISAFAPAFTTGIALGELVSIEFPLMSVS